MTHNVLIVIDMQLWGDKIITKEDAIEEAKRGIRNRIKENGIEYLINHCMEFKYGGTFVSACDIPNTEAHKLANKQCKEAICGKRDKIKNTGGNYGKETLLHM